MPRSIVIALLVCLLCGPAYSVDATWDIYRDDTLQISFVYPKNWLREQPRLRSTAVLLVHHVANDPSRGANCNLQVNEFPYEEGFSEDDIKTVVNAMDARMIDEMLRPIAPNLTIQRRSKDIVDGWPSHFFLISSLQRNAGLSVFLTIEGFFTVRKQRMWMFMCSTAGATAKESANNFERWQITFEKIFRSFLFRVR